MSQYPAPPPDDQRPLPGPHLREQPVGVYHQAQKKKIDWAPGDLYVPRFLSPKFFAFLGSFLRNPAANPVFLREVRRNGRRFGFLSQHPLAFVVITSVLLTFLTLPAAQLLKDAPFHTIVLILAPSFFLPAMMGALIAFFACISGSQELTNRAMLDELAATLLRPQEIVWGNLTGGLVPLSLLALPLAPAVGLMSLFLSTQVGNTMLLTTWSGFGMLIWFWPNVIASMFCAGAIASTVSFGQPNYRAALQKSLITWIAATLLVFGPIYLGLIQTLHLFYLVGIPLVILVKLFVAGAFLNHLAWRLASEQHSED